MKKNNNHVLCHKIGKNRTSQNNFAFNIFQFILLVILLLKTNYCFGQPSSDSWKEVISKMYTRTIPVSPHKNCVFPFKIGNKYYSDCYRNENISKYVCCSSNENCDLTSEVCRISQKDTYLPAYISVIGSYVDAIYGEINGTYILLNVDYDANAQTPLYQKVAASLEEHGIGYFLTFDSTSTPPRWSFFADWDRETDVLVNSVTATSKSQQPNRLPSKENEQAFIPPGASPTRTNIRLVPYVIVPENPILSSTVGFCHDSCEKSFTSPSDIQMCTTSCNSRCSGRGYIDTDNITCMCFADYKGPECQFFCSDDNTKGRTCDPMDNTQSSKNTCNKNGKCTCSTGDKHVGQLCQFKCNAAVTCSNHGHCDVNATSIDTICICDQNYFGSSNNVNCNCFCNRKKTCNGHGECTSRCTPDECKCDTGYVGGNCQYECDVVKDCNSQGTCGADGNCICNPGYIGTNCQFSCVDSKDCSGHGKCTIRPDRNAASCQCDCDYYGEDCSQYNSSCTSSNYCKHDSCCTGTDQCACKVATPPETQYYGKQCNIQEINCSTTNCNGRGSCLFNQSTVNPFALSCKCNEPFSGPNCNVCSNKGEDCACTTGCSGHGACARDGSCQCHCNYYGDQCQFYNARCVDEGYCNNGGCCAAANCICPTGIYGPTCDIFLKDCDAAYCGNRGTCNVITNDLGYQSLGPCTCKSPFNNRHPGMQCETCKKNGIVNAEDNTCKCQNGWQGDDCDISTAVSNVTIITILLLVFTVSTLSYHFYVTVWKLDSAPSDYDDFASLTNLTRKERTWKDTILEFIGRCFVHYIFCTPCRDYRSYKDHKGNRGGRHFKIRKNSKEDSSAGLDLINRESDLGSSSEYTSFNSNSPFNPGSGGFGEDIPLSYQRMED